MMHRLPKFLSVPLLQHGIPLQSLGYFSIQFRENTIFLYVMIYESRIKLYIQETYRLR